jgi:hypothetical protein
MTMILAEVNLLEFERGARWWWKRWWWIEGRGWWWMKKCSQQWDKMVDRRKGLMTNEEVQSTGWRNG